MPNRKRNILHILRGLAVPAVIGGLLWLGLWATPARAGNPVTAPVLPAPVVKIETPRPATSPVVRPVLVPAQAAPAAATAAVIPSPQKESPEPVTGTISGVVRDNSGKFLSAKVDFGDPGTPAARTDPATGAFRVKTAPGRYRLEVKAEGYQPESKKLKVKAGGETRADFTLKAEKKKLAPAAVTSPVVPPAKLKTQPPSAVTSPVIPPRAAAAVPPILEIFPPVGEIQNGYQDEDGCPDTLFLGIKGRLLDRQTGQPVEALLTITKERASEILKTLKGIWVWKSAVPGRYTLKIEAEGYQPQVLNFFLLSGQEIILDLRLAPLAAAR